MSAKLARPGASTARARLRVAVRLALVLTVGAGALGSSACGPVPDEPTVLAVVNGKLITQEELEYRWAELPPATIERYRQEGGKRKFLDDLITRELLLQEARRRGLDQALPIRERLARLKEQVLLDELMRQIAQPTASAEAADLRPEEVEAYYAAHADALLHTEQIRLAQIVVSTLEEAQELKQQLDEGADFARLARRHSTDVASRGKGGDLGYVRKGGAEPAIERAALKLKPGMVSDPIKGPNGIHLIKVLAREIPDTEETRTIRQRLRQELRAEKSRRRFEEFLASLKGKGTIRLHEASRLVAEEKSDPRPTP